MILGIGTDIIKNDRFNNFICKEKLILKIFSQNEYIKMQKLNSKNSKIIFLASRFSAKESFVKALGCGFNKHIKARDIEVIKDKLNKPYIKLNANTKSYIDKHFQGIKIFLSISHQKYYSISYIIIEKS